MSEATVEAPVVNRPRKPRRQTFSMDFWDDEIQARRFIPHNLKIIQSNAKDNGEKTRFLKPKVDEDTGITTIGVEFGTEREEMRKGKLKVVTVIDHNNYIKVHYDRNRKLPKRRRKKAD
jgi:hypothetical protein